MNVQEVLENIAKEEASDIFVVAGRPLTYKVHGKMHTYEEEKMLPDSCRDFVTAIYALADHRDMTHFETTGDDDFSFAIKHKFYSSLLKQKRYHFLIFISGNHYDKSSLFLMYNFKP